MERPRVLHIFLKSWYQDNQGTMRGQNSSGGESGVLNNQIEIKFYSKLDDGLSAQLFPAQKPMKKNNNKNIQ